MEHHRYLFVNTVEVGVVELLEMEVDMVVDEYYVELAMCLNVFESLLSFDAEMAWHIIGYPRMDRRESLRWLGIKYIPSITFSCYDQVLDAKSMLGAVPPRYSWNGGKIGFDTYFSMTR
ncbi:hypothetical protein V6N13_014494 [Hibiscus sabdariffa]|uniref:Cobalamin-independent methionine synthase MetE N-terminal domain-containing protein n=1 Tax=Hibiscus sabdariffa TaxID=183260 RepID=A0ABR2RVS7_9ROSI